MIYSILILIFVFISAIISASETAFRTVNVRKIQALADEGNRSAQILSGLLRNPTILVATIMVTFNISTISVVIFLALEIFEYEPLKNTWGIFLLFGLAFFILFIFTDLLPKAYAANNPEKVALQMAYPVKLFHTIFRPFIYMTNTFSGSILSKIGGNFSNLMKQFTEEEIKTLVDIGHESGVLEQYETKIIQSALAIDDLTVNSVLTPRVDIEAVSVDTTVENILDLMLTEEYSRLPVYEDNVDNIVGIVHIKDLFKASKEFPENMQKSVRPFMREAFHVPENKTISELLKEMQAKRLQMAIVCDEYGGTAGLVTMEDILEEIVGEIRDEHDIDEMPLIYEIDKNNILVDARAGVGEVNRILGTNLPNNQTVGRLIFDTLGEVPKLEQTLKIDNIDLKIKEIDGIRVQKVMISKNTVSFTSGLTEGKGDYTEIAS